MNLGIVIVCAIPFIFYKEYMPSIEFLYIIYAIMIAFVLWTGFSFFKMSKPALVIGNSELIVNTNIFKQNIRIEKQLISEISIEEKISKAGQLHYLLIKHKDGAIPVYGENLTMNILDIHNALLTWIK